MDDMRFSMSPHSGVAQEFSTLLICVDEERKFPVTHRLINLSFRSNQLSELARQSDNRVPVRRSGTLSAYFVRQIGCIHRSTRQAGITVMIRGGCGSKTGSAALLKKKSPPRKRKHQLRGCNEDGGKKAIEQTSDRSNVFIF
jgi:hypothetical protein